MPDGIRQARDKLIYINMSNNSINSIRKITSCRVCGLKNLIPILSLGQLYVSNFVESGADSEEKHPLDLVLCNKQAGGCGLLQLRHTVSPKKMYRNYWYRSGVNKTMTEELTAIAKTAEKITRPAVGDMAVDIGCNDGTLLRAYETKNLVTIGFEPAENLISYAARGTSHIFNDFFRRETFAKKFGDKKAKIITAIAMFYDLDRPNEFVADIKKMLDRGGVFIIQMSYVPSMLSQNAFDNICHEHLEYYGLNSLDALLSRHGLEIFDVELNEVNGGSFRAYIRHTGTNVGGERQGREERVAELVASEHVLKLDKKETYDQFANRVALLRKKTHDFIVTGVSCGKKVYVYGASTKGNTLLQYYGLDSSLITAAAERNPIKWNKKTIGTAIPIISEEQARQEKPDYFLVLPWHFLPEFLEREKEYRASGGKFIVPLPEFKVI